MKPIHSTLPLPRLIAVFACLALGCSAIAQDAKSLVAAMPAANIQDETAACAQLVKLGPAAIKEICAGLQPLDGEDDTKARYAITALGRYCGRPGAEPDRMMLCKTLCEAIPGGKDVEIKVFLIERLETVSCDGAVGTLAPLLSEDKLVNPAARALVVIGTPAAGKAIADALAGAPATRQLALVQALGAIRYEKAGELLPPFLKSEDKLLRDAALWGLANIGDASAIKQAAKTATAGKDEARRFRQLELLCARRLAEKGNKQAAWDLCGSPLMKDAETLYTAAMIDPADRYVSEVALLNGVSEDVLVRAPALNLAGRFASVGATGQWTSFVADRKLPAAARIDILAMLARRGDKSATDAVLAATKDEDPAVRLAAAESLAKLAPDAAIDPLITMLKSARTEQVKPLAELIARMKGERPMAALASALAEAPATSWPAIIEVLAARPTAAGREAVFKQAEPANTPVRLAALKALEKLAEPADVPRLVAMAMSATEPGEEAAALRTAGIAATALAPASRADAFLAALPNTQGAKRAALLRAIGKAGGPRAIEALSADLKSADAATRDAALRALAESSDPGAIDPLMAVARDSAATQAQQLIALRGAIQVVRTSTLPSAQKVQRLAAALQLVKRPDERRAILSALATEHTAEALALAAPLMQDESVKAEAALAVIRIAVPTERGSKPLSGPAVVEALKKAIPLCPDQRARADAQKLLSQIEKK